MPAPKKRFSVPGSERAPLRGAREIGPANPNELVDVTIRLRSRAGKKHAPFNRHEVASRVAGVSRPWNHGVRVQSTNLNLHGRHTIAEGRRA